MELRLHPLVAHVEERLTAWYGSAFAQRRWVVAVSGGLDSMSLWRVLEALIPPSNLAVAHFNHGTRGGDSIRDEYFVRARAEGRGMKVFVEATAGEGRSEDWLRARRKDFLDRVRVAWGAEAVLTAHHGSDQFETFLMRVLRGSGLDGLGAIRPNHGGFARPLLGIPRSELERFSSDTGIEYLDDGTNHTDRYLRNRVRRSLVPAFRVLAAEFGGEEAFLRRLNDTLEELQGAAHWMATETDKLYGTHAVPTPFWIRLPSEALLGLPSLWATRLIGRVGAELGVSGATRSQRDRVLRAAETGQGGFELTGGIRGEVSCGHIFFYRLGFTEPVSPGVGVEGNRLRCGAIGWSARTDADWLCGREVRFFRPGDRYEGQKLKEWYLERRVPAPERPLVPLVARAGESEVVWVFPDAVPGLHSEGMSFPFSFLPPRRNSPVVPAP